MCCFKKKKTALEKKMFLLEVMFEKVSPTFKNRLALESISLILSCLENNLQKHFVLRVQTFSKHFQQENSHVKKKSENKSPFQIHALSFKKELIFIINSLIPCFFPMGYI